MTTLLELKAPKPRFARSINVERDADSDAIGGYLPVGRAIDAITRIGVALNQANAEVAFSIVGPYGSGKSSLAVVIDALLGPAADGARLAAEGLLSQTAPNALDVLNSAKRRLGAQERGFIRAFATAQREPISATVLRALIYGAKRYEPAAKQRSLYTKGVRQLSALFEACTSGANARLEPQSIRSAVAALGEVAPVFLLIDEFGKNLEAFADSRSDGDLFLLQELAEWTRGDNSLPLAVVTMQHMAFDEYVDDASKAQRREWAKIQGRFEDIPFVDSAAQTRALIGAAFTQPAAVLRSVLEKWSVEQVAALTQCGLTDLAVEPALLESCWPLHPVTLAVLPELCERYGQNERTLFSFLAGHEPLGVATFLSKQEWKAVGDLPLVRLDRVYDYFLESASTMVGVSSAASRWLEIDSRIRDSHGLEPAQLRILKTVGLLNLISAGGTLRASRVVIKYVATDGQRGSRTPRQVESRLDELERAGLVTFRDFADEFRVWQGSDFDLRASLDVARRRVRDESAAATLTRVLPLTPLVAARHSHQTGTLRAFKRMWVDEGTESIDQLGGHDCVDGLALYALTPDVPVNVVQRRADQKPVAFITSADPSSLLQTAREVAAIDNVLEGTADLDDDWVARRELLERRIEARAALEQEFERTFGATSASRGDWMYLRPTKRVNWAIAEGASASQALSVVADVWYRAAPRVHNDLVNRHELSSQAAKARRLLLEAMLKNASVEGLGIQGFGPDRTMYLSVLQALGIHRLVEGEWHLTEPPSDSGAADVWAQLIRQLRGSAMERTRVDRMYCQLARPPWGVRPGVAPILLFAALLAFAEELALYEHGTFRPVLTSDVVERLLRNPGNFEVKHFASRDGCRATFLAAASEALAVSLSRGKRRRTSSVLAVLSHLVMLVNALPDYVKRTSYLETDVIEVRRHLMLATEPDELLFTSLPRALGKAPLAASGQYPQRDMDELVDRLAGVADELRLAFPRLLAEIRRAMLEELRGPETRFRETLAVRAAELDGRVVDQRVRRLVVALVADIPGDDEWAEYVGMNVTGVPPSVWTDDDRRQFFTAIHDVGSTFRRLEALNSDLRSRGDGFDALRVTVTRPDGIETAKLVWVDEARKAGLGDIVAEMIDRARPCANSDAEARDLLLALLAEIDLHQDGVESIDRNKTPSVYTGTRRLGKGATTS